MDLTQTLSTALGAGGTGALVLWLTKLMLARWVNQNDEKHATHEKSHQELEDKIDKLVELVSDVRLKMAAFEVRAADMVGMKEDMRRTSDRVAVIGESLKKNQKDLQEAFQQIKLVRGVR